jgi:hypothetical protein
MPDDVEQCWDSFKQVLQGTVERFVPTRRIGASKYRKPIWMTQKAVKAVKKKHNMYHRFRDSDNPRYKKASRSARIEIRKAKRNFEKKLAENIKRDTKSFFAYVRSKTAVKASVGPLFGHDDELVTDPREISEVMNSYFAKVFTEENTESVPDDPVFDCSRQVPNCNSIIIDESVVMFQLNKQRADKATGVDEISPRLLFEIKNEVCHPLTVLFRKSLDTGCVPNDWRLANVSPIHKKGSRNKSENYRPVSLTSQICRIFESIMRDTIVKHLESNALINETQHGFRGRRSCLTNLLVFMDKLTRAIDEGYDLDVVYLDFAKAFDKVPHQRLISKLQKHGLDGGVLEWIRAWLSNRKQRVSIRGEKSGWRSVTSGIPQGSVLGPLLFIMFINDIDNVVQNSLLKFADDTKIFGVIQNKVQHQQLQDDLSNLVDWSKKWQMQFNTSKCKVLHIGKTNHRYQYVMDNQVLESVKEERDLGVVISDDLKVSANCQDVYSKANRILGMINRSITYRSKDILVPLYKSLVRPLVEYCTPAWSPYYQKDKDLIERLQHRLTRMIPRLKLLPYTDRLRELNLWSLEERRNRADLIEVYRICHGLSGIQRDDLFELVVDSRTRGHSLKLKKFRCRLDLRKYFFSERVVDRWNLLDDETVKAVSLNSFKNRLNKLRQRKMGFFMDT